MASLGEKNNELAIEYQNQIRSGNIKEANKISLELFKGFDGYIWSSYRFMINMKHIKDYEEYKQEAYIYMIKALSKFIPGKTYFGTYFVNWLKKCRKDFCASMPMVSIPVSLSMEDHVNACKGAYSLDYRGKEGLEYSNYLKCKDKDLKKENELFNKWYNSYKNYNENKNKDNKISTLSLNKRVSGGGRGCCDAKEFIDSVKSEDPKRNDVDIFKIAKNVCTKQECTILDNWYEFKIKHGENFLAGDPSSYTKVFGVTRQAVEVKIKVIFDKIKNSLEIDGINKDNYLD